MKADGPDGASSNGFNENLALFQQGKCGMWIDATVAASFVTDPKDSTVADKVGFALAPDKGLGKRGNWLWAWSLAIPAGTPEGRRGREVHRLGDRPSTIAELVASKEGWANVPPGTRTSLYANADYQKAAPFAKMTLDSINSADPTKPTVKPVPYVGVQFVAIPEFQGLGTDSRPALLGGARRPDVGRRRAEAGAGRRPPARCRRRATSKPQIGGAPRRVAYDRPPRRSGSPGPSSRTTPMRGPHPVAGGRG